MNAATSASSKQPASTAQIGTDTRRPVQASGSKTGPASSEQDRNAFSRSLQAKERGLAEAQEAQGSDADGQEQSPLQLMMQRSAAPLEAIHPSTRGAATNATPSVTAERLALTGTLDNSLSAQQTGLKTNDAAQSWQANLPGANGSALQINASFQPGTVASQPMWAVAITTPAAEAAAFSRQANRLNDRLHDRLASRGTGLRVAVQSAAVQRSEIPAREARPMSEQDEH